VTPRTSAKTKRTPKSPAPGRGETRAAAIPDGVTRRSFARDAAIIFTLALLVRILHIWQIRRAPFFGVLMGDARGYDEWAQRIAGGDWIGTDVFYQAPLYPYMLGVVYSIAGHSLFAVRICQAILGSASCVLLGLSAARLFSNRAGLIAGLILAFYAPAIFFDGLIQKSVLDVFFICLTLWLMSVLSSTPGQPRSAPAFLALGLALGALALTRENALVLVAVVGLWIATTPVSRVRGLAAFALGLALVLLPVAVRNYAVGGGFYLTTSQFGPNLYIGNNPRSDGTYMALRYGRGAPEYERQDATELAEHALGRTLTPAEVSSFWTDRAVEFISSQPGAWLKLVGRKFALLWNADEMLDTESQETYAEWSLPLRALSWIGHFGILAPLAFFGAMVLWPDRRRLWVFYAMTAAYAASVILFYVFARYRFPLVPFLVLFAATALSLIGDQLFFTGAGAPPPARTYADAPSRLSADAKGHGRRRSVIERLSTAIPAPVIIATAIAAVFSNWPMLSKTRMQAITENNLAAALQEDGRLEDAIAHYQRASAIEPDYAPAYSNMGVALRAAGQLERAVASYRQALALQADYPDAHYNLANALLEQNKPEEAAEHFRIALQSIPGSAGTHNNLAIALASQGKVEEAIAEFRAALAAEPDSAKTHRNLGNALSEAGRTQEGVEHLRRAIALDPKDPAAHYDLGSELLQASQFAEAASEFRESLKLDPKSAAAHNNLGIALASLNRVDEAIQEFQRALALQPDLADARRNLDLAQVQKRGRGR